jgi:hypothetical protein
MNDDQPRSVFADLRSLAGKGAEINASHVLHIARRFVAEDTASWAVEDVVRSEFGGA